MYHFFLQFLTDGPDPIRHAYNDLIFPHLNMAAATATALPSNLAWARDYIEVKKRKTKRFQEGASPHFPKSSKHISIIFFIILTKSGWIPNYDFAVTHIHIYIHPSELGFTGQNSTVAGYEDALDPSQCSSRLSYPLLYSTLFPHCSFLF